MNFSRPLILASSSPRRKQLLHDAGFRFTVEPPGSDESFPEVLPVDEVARYLAVKKAELLRGRLHETQVALTADTVVILDGDILNKPSGPGEAIAMLTRLAGRTHKVMTGVCLISVEQEVSFDDSTLVTFATLSRKEIEFYVEQYTPFDKAGAYGAQDWIGLVGVERIEGSYFNVMGLPMHKVYQHLKLFQNAISR
jgi:septum formation protein